MSNKAIWTKKRKGIEFSAHEDGCVYVAFDWNGVLAWEYCCGLTKKGNAGFVKYLRQVADKIERDSE